jgi:hypothetical protein
MTKPEIAAQRARLAELDDALTQLRAQYDVLMNAFKFDEARTVAAHIEVHEQERQKLAAMLPPLPEPGPTPYAGGAPATSALAPFQRRQLAAQRAHLLEARCRIVQKSGDAEQFSRVVVQRQDCELDRDLPPVLVQGRNGSKAPSP